MTEKAYPLHWPENWPRNQRPASSQFKTSLAGALKNVQDSIRKFANDSGKKVDDLGFTAGTAVSKDMVEKRFKELVKKHHPDNGGDAEKMAEINQAVAEARQELK